MPGVQSLHYKWDLEEYINFRWVYQMMLLHLHVHLHLINHTVLVHLYLSKKHRAHTFVKKLITNVCGASIIFPIQFRKPCQLPHDESKTFKKILGS